MQLAVTVSMPSPQHPSYRPPPHHTHANVRDKHNEGDTMPDCCIGTVLVSYRHDPNDSPAPTPASSPAAS